MVVTILGRGIHPVSSAPAISSLFNETVVNTSHILCACQTRWTSISSGCASHSRILHERFLYPPNAPLSCAHRSGVPPKCASPQWWWKKIKHLLSGPLCEGHSALPSLLAVCKPMLYLVDGVQSVTVHALIPVVRRLVAGQCISEWVARWLGLAEIVRNTALPPAAAVSIVLVIAAVWR